MGDAQLEPLLNAFQQTLAPSPVCEDRLSSTERTGAAARRRQLAHHPDRFSVLLQELIKQAEAFLKTASQQPGYGIMVLKARRCLAAAAQGRLPAATCYLLGKSFIVALGRPS